MGHNIREFEADLRQSCGLDYPDLLGMSMSMTLRFMYSAVPDPPVSRAARLASSAAGQAPTDGVDRISRLPGEILKNVILRLPAKDAARTGALASRWRGLWLSAPLALVDVHVLPDRVPIDRTAVGGDDITSKAVVAAVSRALAAHPGPLSCFYVTRGHMASHQADAERWLQLLAAKVSKSSSFFSRTSLRVSGKARRCRAAGAGSIPLGRLALIYSCLAVTLFPVRLMISLVMCVMCKFD
jgi:hypothetical protein